MMDIKLGIIGTNFVSDWLADCVRAVEGITVPAVYSRKKETGDAFAKKHSIPAIYTDMGDFLSSDIDAVYIASPNALHFSQAEAAMRRKKHVLLEKPAALSEEDFVRLSQIAREEGVVLVEAMRPAHDPVMQEVRKTLPKLGKLRRAVFEFCQYSSRYDRFKAGEVLNAFNPKLGNAAVMDIGVYAVHSCVMLFGMPDSVEAESFIFENGMEGMGNARLKYGGFTAEIVYSKIHDSVAQSYITGELGSVTIGKLSTGEDVTLRMRGKEGVPLMAERQENNMVYEVEDFVKAIRGEIGTDEFVENTRITMRVIDEIRRQGGIRFE